MLTDLRFVQGAVAKKDYDPKLTHFCIQDGKILGYNGAIALCTPTDLPINCAPQAVPFIKAIKTCKDTVELHMTPNGRLCVRSGKFTAHVECLEETYPTVVPEGQIVDLAGCSILEPLQSISTFIGQDASRGWARGILLRGQSALATNNIVIIERWLGFHFPVEVNVPEAAVDELLRIGEEPTHVQVGENHVTFHFAKDRWLRCQVLSTEWPDVSRVMDRESKPVSIPDGLFPALEDLTPFCDDDVRVFFHEGAVSTVPIDGIGASVQVDGILRGACYNIKQLRLLEGVANEIDFTMYPDPCMFYGDKIRGAIVGMRY